jgi:hypothetical protein
MEHHESQGSFRPTIERGSGLGRVLAQDAAATPRLLKWTTIPERPTRADAILACDTLREVIVDFPFKSEAHWSAWLAGVLTPFGVHAFYGPAPFFLVDANVRGAGKSLTTDCIAEIVTGRAFPRSSDRKTCFQAVADAHPAEPLRLLPLARCIDIPLELEGAEHRLIAATPRVLPTLENPPILQAARLTDVTDSDPR